MNAAWICRKVTFVDLTNNSIVEENLSEELARNFIGGYGIGAKILYDMMPPGADPLVPRTSLGLPRALYRDKGIFRFSLYTGS